MPGKNIKKFDGIPLIAHSIQFALKQEAIDQVFVSTDSEAIASVARKYNANILRRPNRLAADHTPTSEVAEFHLQELLNEGMDIEWVFLLQPTNPLRPSELIATAFQELIESGRSALASFSPTEKKFGIIKDNRFYPESYKFGQRSQDINPRYYENGLLYVVKGELAAKGIFFPQDLYPFIIDSLHATVDIDYQRDLEYAKIVLNYLKESDR